MSKCEPHGFEDCCNVEIPSLDASECLDFHEGNCDGAVEYRVAMSPTGISYPRCGHHNEIRVRTQERISRLYGVPMWY